MNFSLHDLGLLDAPVEEEFDKLTDLACELLNVPAAHVSILDRVNKRVFYKSQQGHPSELADARELPMELTYCQHVALTNSPVIVPDARDHPLLIGTPALCDGSPRAYLGIPIAAPVNEVVGGLCMMQPDARVWSDSEIKMASKLAACVSDLIRLRSATLTSERLRREQRDFTYSISHDLRSPANTVRMIIDEIAIEKDRLSDDVRQLVGEASGTLDRMGQQIEDVLVYARTLGRPVCQERVDLNVLISNILSDLRGCIADKGAVIKCDALPAVTGQPMQLTALFQNLITNAMKFSRPGEAPVVRIQSRCCGETGGQCVSVADNGIGIAVEDQPKVFDLFNRLNLRKDYEGTGIGLTLCRRVAETHNATIAVRSDGRTGTTFTVKFPEVRQ